MYYCKTRYYVPLWGRWLNADSSKYLEFKQLNKCNLFSYCYNNPINVCDENGNLPTWAKRLIGGVLIAASVALSIVTFGLGTAIAGAISTVVTSTLAANVIGGAVAGALVGAVSSALMNIGTQIITKDIEDFSWGEVCEAALTGGIAGGIAGGIFGGISHIYKSKIIADYLSDLSSAQSRLDNAFNSLRNIRNYVGKPFGNSNIMNELANCIANYNNAYINYISAKINYQIFYYGMEAIYFVLESIVSAEISKNL